MSLTYGLASDATTTLGGLSLTSGGTALSYSVSGNTVTASAGGNTVFTFTVSSVGAYTFTLVRPLDHTSGSDENDLTLNLGGVVLATDKDGDTVKGVAGSLVITVDDDTPTANTLATALSGTVDEDGLASGIAGGTVGGEHHKEDQDVGHLPARHPRVCGPC